MVLSWLGLALWTFRPAARELHHDAANMIFEENPENSQAESQADDR
jgi:cbb3-type cytochrome oxidase subunit 3